MVDIKFIENNVYINAKDLDLRQTLDCGQAFRFKTDENGMWTGVVKQKVLKLYKKDEYIVIENLSEDEFFNDFYEYFTFFIDYEKIKEILSADDILKQAISMSPGIRLLNQEKFETICSFIFSQNNNIPRIKGIIERFCEQFGEKLQDGFYAFPTAEKIAQLTVDDLSPIRAGFRAKYIIDAAKKCADNLVLEDLYSLDIDSARTALMTVKGVGPKVADCTLLFGFGFHSAFPMDVWMKRAMATLFDNKLPDGFEDCAGIIQQYIFQYARTEKLSF